MFTVESSLQQMVLQVFIKFQLIYSTIIVEEVSNVKVDQ